MNVRSHRVMFVFQREFTLYNCLNVKELLTQNRRDIWSLSDCNGAQSHLTVHSHHVTYAFQSESTLYKCTIQISTHNTVQSFGRFGQMGWVFVYELSGYGFESHCSHWRRWTLWTVHTHAKVNGNWVNLNVSEEFLIMIIFASILWIGIQVFRHYIFACILTIYFLFIQNIYTG